ncbi:COP9 signalosome complex subunit 5 [Colletotrichum sidae]|uniref:COP9 signalosome complex subunit 5 n=2 Tax=Colletotrichum orbiculare species complex TaxID=2707354 RepID=N4VE14_COLOR|nr:COP9 signalosome complex subunit 5 [Colletotrichum orbiculare MAFF 240422]TEA17888.1 COP9 signalosome complex subunit 5 [Colletotrichum sidae]
METALKSWELDNNVNLVDPKRDALYNLDTDAQKEAMQARPWAQKPNHFKNVRISAVALIKMVMHARSGGNLEIMGLMQGFVNGDTFIVTDAFRLPVEGTETRVNAQGDAEEYMVEYLSLCREQGRMENVVGWYHSHPGYGCWLSGIDVSTQALQQQFQEPFLAVVIDPDRTINAGKVEIGAFRTYPENYAKEKEAASGGVTSDGWQEVPLAKAAEFGAHASKYYSLEVSHFKSTLDAHLLELLWHKYWVQTLSQNPLLTNREYGNRQMLDLASKIQSGTRQIYKGRLGQPTYSMSANSIKYMDGIVEKLVKETNTVATQERTGLVAMDVKKKIFNDATTNAS